MERALAGLSVAVEVESIPDEVVIDLSGLMEWD